MADERDESSKKPDEAMDLTGDAREAYARARTAAYDFQTGLLHTIRQKPVRSVFFAVGVGFLIGAILNRGGRR